MLIALIQNWCHTIIIIIIALVLKMLFFICIEFVGHREIIYSCGFAAKCFFVAYFLGLLSNTFEISREIALLSCRTFLKAFSPIQAKMDIFCWWVKYQPVNRLTKYWNSGQWLPDPTSPDSLVPSTSSQVTWTRGTSQSTVGKAGRPIGAQNLLPCGKRKNGVHGTTVRSVKR